MKSFRRVAFFLVLPVFSVVLACATQQRDASDETQAKRLGGSSLGFPIIDAHVHTRFTGGEEPNTKIPLTREQFLSEMRENGIVGAVAHTGTQGENYHSDLKQHGVIHCRGVDGRPDLGKIEAGLKDGKYSCLKIYLGYVHLFAHDPVYRPVYALAEKYDVPVVFHTGDTYSNDGKLKYADPLTIDEVAVDHRKVRFVIAHLGNPWIESAAEVAYKNPNVWLEGSALLIGNMSNEPRSTVDQYLVKPLAWALGYMESPSKLMYGTDWPLNDMRGYLEAYKRAIPREHWRAVFHDNAAQVFKFR